MKKQIKLLNIFVLLFGVIGFPFFAGCSAPKSMVNLSPRFSEVLSQGVYATNDSINVGRFDLAKTYSDQTIRIVPPPIGRIKIKPLSNKEGEKINIVTDHYSATTLLANSQEIQNMSNLLDEERESIEKFKNQTDWAVREKERLIRSLSEENYKMNLINSELKGRVEGAKRNYSIFGAIFGGIMAIIVGVIKKRVFKL
jgi:predicted nuclease with TOPRIM domain